MKCLALCLATVLLAGCARDRSPLETTFPPASQLSIPYSAAFRADRKSGDGFLDPVDATRAFMTKVFAADPDEALLRDDGFCRKFFSGSLRQRVATSRAQFDQRIEGREPQPEDADPASGGSRAIILSAWDAPTDFRLAGHHLTRRDYTVNEVRHRDASAVVDVVYEWGKGTQYEGDERVTSVILVREGGRWFVDDLYTQNGDYCSPSSFYQTLVK